MNVFGQDSSESGQNYNPTLNLNEAAYLNKSLETQKASFDFAHTKVIFATGNNASRIITKKQYFNQIVKPYLETNSQVVNYLVLLNPNEKRQSGGHNALLVAWSKMEVTDKRKKKIIKKMHTAREHSQLKYSHAYLQLTQAFHSNTLDGQKPITI